MKEEEKQEVHNQVAQERFVKDIVVLEDMHEVPIFNEEFHTHYFYMGMCRKGYIDSAYDYQTCRFGEGDFSWIMPNHVLRHYEVSPDYSVLSLFLGPDFYQRLRSTGMLGRYQYMTSGMNIVHLDPEMFSYLSDCILLLGRMANVPHPRREEHIAALVHIISSNVDHYIQSHGIKISPVQKLHEELFERFYDAVTKHYRESREVSFYANLFNRTPKYFATVIKETTGIPATEWIKRYVIIEAKWLLLHDRQKSVQQIAYHLGFTEQASFSRLFKQYEGMTPTEFRDRN